MLDASRQKLQRRHVDRVPHGGVMVVDEALQLLLDRDPHPRVERAPAAMAVRTSGNPELLASKFASGG